MAELTEELKTAGEMVAESAKTTPQFLDQLEAKLEVSM